MAAPVNVFGTKPAGLKTFVDTGFDGDDFRLAEHIGKAGIFTVHGPEEVNTRNGLKTAVKADVVILDGTGGKKFSGVLIFNQVPVSQLSASAGQTLVALIDSYEAKSGGRAPKLAEPTPAAVQAAEAYLAG